MTHETFQPRETSSAALGSSAASLGLPPDLVEKACQRLGLAAMIYAVAYALAYGSARLVVDFSQILGTEGPVYHSDVIAVGFIGLSIGMFFVARSGALAPATLLDVGLLYEVVGAAGIEIGILWQPVQLGAMEVTGISWTCVWLVTFPVLVPSTPRKTVAAALAAASMMPLMFLIVAIRGNPTPDAGALTMLVLPNYISAGIAIAASRVIYRLGSAIGHARRMGSYYLEERLGQGGMGEVWRATHRMLARPAAIKLVRTEAIASGESGRTSSSQLQRFEREVQATAQLRSPHTVEVYDYGLTEDGTFYYVMELLDGLSLQDLVERYGPVPPERAIHILRQACHSLAEAHDRGLVHRDIKPANIFICRYGREFDFVKVLDFGLVKRAGPAPRDQAQLTQVGAYLGTPAYGPPETATGEIFDIDRRSDLYSLGCVGFWLLTGRIVFPAPTAVMMLFQHVNQQPDPPSRYAAGRVPQVLDDVVLACLRKNKEERPGSADILDAMLAAVDVTDPWTQERAREWWQRHLPTQGDPATPLSEREAVQLTVA